MVDISALQVSQVSAHSDVVPQERRQRPQGEIAYPVNTRYYEVKQISRVCYAVVTMMTGIALKDERQVVGISISLSEYEVHWETFFKVHKDCEMSDLKLVNGTDHEGGGASRTGSWEMSPGKSAKSTCSRILEHR